MNKLLASFKYAFNGINYVFTTQRNFRIQSFIFILVIILGFVYSISCVEWTIILFISSLVFSLEILNTAIENLVNLLTDDYHHHAEKAKDAAAGAVLISSILAFAAGLVIFIPKIFV